MREDKILDCSNPQTVMSERELDVSFSNVLTSLELEHIVVDFSSIQKKKNSLKDLFSCFFIERKQETTKEH